MHESERPSRHDRTVEQQDGESAPRQDARRGVPRRFVHDIGARRVQAKRDGGRAVRDHGDPEDLDCAERRLQTEERRDQHGEQRAEVRRELEADEFDDVVVDGPPLLDRADDGREIVVGKDHARGALRDLGPGAHRDADVRLSKGRCVVHPVAGDGDDVLSGLQCRHDAQLVLGGDAREDGDARKDGGEHRVVHAVELGAGDRIAHEAERTRDRHGRRPLVSREHLHRDPGALAAQDGVARLCSRRIQHSDEAEERELLHELGELLGLLEALRGDLAHADGEDAESVGRDSVVLGAKPLPAGVVERPFSGRQQGPRAAVEQRAGRPLRVHVHDVAIAVEGRHETPLGLEGHFTDARRRPAELLHGETRLRR